MVFKNSLLKQKSVEIKGFKDILPGFEPPLNNSCRYIPVYEPDLEGNELKYITECVKSSWISSRGAYVNKFEKSFSSFCSVRFGIACSSGTSALHLALAAIGVGPNEEVILPVFTMIATANAVAYTGATPVFVDANPNNWNIDADRIEEKINNRTRAIIVVHTYGYPVDMDKVIAIAKKHRLIIIEDAAEAHGAEYKGQKVGGLGDIACFSFYGNKIITTGEGGMLLTKNKKIARIVRILRDHGFSKKRHFWHKYTGFNYRMTNLQAAIGLAQMERVDELISRHIQQARLYRFSLKKVKGIALPPETKDRKNVFWLFTVLIRDTFKINRNQLRIRLANEGVETRAVFIPMHLQPIYYKKYYQGKFPVAEDLCRRGICLPSGARLKKSHIELITKLIKSYSA
jgi:perosamine synthetase